MHKRILHEMSCVFDRLIQDCRLLIGGLLIAVVLCTGQSAAQSPASHQSLESRGGAREFEGYIRPCPEHLELRVSVRPVSSADGSDGAIDIEVLGGVAPLQYSWQGLHFHSNAEDLRNIPAGEYELIVSDDRGCDVARRVTVTSAGDDPLINPARGMLVWPNPSRGQIAIHYYVPSDDQVRIELFDQSGSRVALLVDSAQQAGRYRTDFLMNASAAGVYYCRMRIGDQLVSQNFMVLR